MKHRRSNLDLVRGVAGLLVCVSHLRAFLMVDSNQVASFGLFSRLFYFATGLGHQAVIVFFVLSGYLVGGSVLAAHRAGRWSWREYGLRRMVRLWTALLPALVLTLALDSVGRSLTPDGYLGHFAPEYHSGPTLNSPADLRGSTFLGNLFFLQTILVPCLGTNGPLWSLANEFWYYVLFPLGFGLFVEPSWKRRLAFGALFAVVVAWLPAAITKYGFIWLFGVGVYAAGSSESLRRIVAHRAWILCGGILFLATLAASKTDSVFGSIWSVGMVFSLWLLGLASTDLNLPWLRKLSAGLADVSYTLYLLNFPILAFVFFGVLGVGRMSPDLRAYVWFASLLALTLAVSAVMWWCFERNTDLVRRRIDAFLSRR